MTARRFALATTTLALVAACDPALDAPVVDDEVTFRCDPLKGTCGPISNTPFTGALNISPLDTQGNLYENIQVHDVILFNSIVLDEFWAEDGQLFGRKGTVTFSGINFLGARFELTAWGEDLALLITQVTPPPGVEVFWLYQFEWTDDNGSDNPVCLPTEPTGDLRAVVHADLVIDGATGDVTSRPDTVYIACLRGAAGEIAYGPLGYGFRPFEVGLAAFEAAMDFLRANYCDDGKSWTEYGQPISYADKWGIGGGVQLGHTDAVWGLNGALCIGSELRAGFTYDDIECPSGTKPPKCSDATAAATYLASGRFWTAIPPLMP
ncbi:ADYC domain-containing protein [Nannocystis pusilla]|uniref:ADYC domain-containing protein n=1 Tax=Nannocystis pusilla TaxID=889268 RepID=A0ABS7TQ41_9BACT|nr:ADYC domain-containing protein [Nannocystis pusilla]MBZ5710206.1 hypothetical protein [Nannocystis pusilla]